MPETMNGRWETVIIRYGEKSDLDKLDQYLAEGWEPFAVTMSAVFHYHLRRWISQFHVNTPAESTQETTPTTQLPDQSAYLDANASIEAQLRRDAEARRKASGS